MENIKQRTLRIFNERKEKEKEKEKLIEQIKNEKFIDDDDDDNDDNNIELNIEENDNTKPKNKDNDLEYISPDTNDDSGTEHESDDSLAEDDDLDELEKENLNPPYFYIDYDEGNIQIAKDFEYKTLIVKRNEGLTEINIQEILSQKMFNFKSTSIKCFN